MMKWKHNYKIPHTLFTVEELLIQEMIEQGSMLNDRQLHHLSNLYTIDYKILKKALPKVLKILHDRSTENL